MSSFHKFSDASMSGQSFAKRLPQNTDQSVPGSSTSRTRSAPQNRDKHLKFDDLQSRCTLSRSSNYSRAVKIGERNSTDKRVNSCSYIQLKNKPKTSIQDNKCRMGLDKKCSLGNSPTASKAFLIDRSSRNRKVNSDNEKSCDKPYLEPSDLHKIASRIVSVSDFYKDEGNCIHEKHHSALSSNKPIRLLTCPKVKGGSDTAKKEFCPATRASGPVPSSERFPSRIYANRYIKAKGSSKDNTDPKGLRSLQSNAVTEKSNISLDLNHLPIQKHIEANTACQQSSVDTQKLKITQTKIPTQRPTSPDLVVLWNSPKKIASKESMAPSSTAHFRTSSIPGEKHSGGDLKTSGMTLPVLLDHHTEASEMRNNDNPKLGLCTSKDSYEGGRHATESSFAIANKATNDLRMNVDFVNEYVEQDNLVHNISDREKGGCMEMENISATTLTFVDSVKSTESSAGNCSAVNFQTDKIGNEVTTSNINSQTECVSGESESGSAKSESSDENRLINSFTWDQRLTCQTLLGNAISQPTNTIEATETNEANETFLTGVDEYNTPKTFACAYKQCGTSSSNVSDAPIASHENNDSYALKQATNFRAVDELLFSQHPFPRCTGISPPSENKVYNVESDKLSRKVRFDVDPKTKFRESCTDEDPQIQVHLNDDLQHQRKEKQNASAARNAQQLSDNITNPSTNCVTTPTTMITNQSKGTENQSPVLGFEDSPGKSIRLYINRKHKNENDETETENEFDLRLPSKNIKIRGLTDGSSPVNELVLSTNFKPDMEVVDNILRLSAPNDDISDEDGESIAAIGTSCSSEFNRLQNKIIIEQSDAKISEVSTDDEAFEQRQGRGLKQCHAEIASTTQSGKYFFPSVPYFKKPSLSSLLATNEIAAGIARQFPDIETKADFPGYAEDRRSAEAGLTGNSEEFPKKESTVIRGWIEAQEALDKQYKLDAEALKNEYFGIIKGKKGKADTTELSQVGRPSRTVEPREILNIFVSSPYQNQQKDSHSTMEHRIISAQIIDNNCKTIDMRAGSSQKNRPVAGFDNQAHDSILDGPSTSKQATLKSKILNRFESELPQFQQPYLPQQVAMALLQLPVPGVGSEQLAYNNPVDANNYHMVKTKDTKESDGCRDISQLEGIFKESRLNVKAISNPVNQVEDNHLSDNIAEKIENSSSLDDSDDDDDGSSLSDFISTRSTRSMSSYIEYKTPDEFTGDSEDSAIHYGQYSDSTYSEIPEFTGCPCMRSMYDQIKFIYLESVKENGN